MLKLLLFIILISDPSVKCIKEDLWFESLDIEIKSILSIKLSFSNTFFAIPNCPLPPSIKIRSGNFCFSSISLFNLLCNTSSKDA